MIEGNLTLMKKLSAEKRNWLCDKKMVDYC